jgi:hypothetical protein
MIGLFAVTPLIDPFCGLPDDHGCSARPVFTICFTPKASLQIGIAPLARISADGIVWPRSRQTYRCNSACWSAAATLFWRLYGANGRIGGTGLITNLRDPVDRITRRYATPLAVNVVLMSNQGSMRCSRCCVVFPAALRHRQ